MSTVSAILTFYNNVDYVEVAVEQALNQTSEDFELIVIDDASVDGTREALQQRLASEPRARFIANDENLGVAASRNKAVAASSGDFVWFIDCDDEWSPNILKTLHTAVSESGADVAICGAVRVTGRGQRRGKQLDGSQEGTFAGREAVRMLLTGGIRGYLWNKMFRRQLLEQFPFPLQSSQSDFATVSEIVFSGATFVVSPEVLYWHVERAGSITNSRIDSFENMASCTAKVEQRVQDRADSQELSGELAYFKQWFYRSSVVNTTLRLGTESAELAEYAGTLRRSASLRDIAAVRRYSSREAAIAALMKYSGPLYPLVYRTYLARA
jgi:glycosyltransferase involved in cell wall biosynthesis